MSQDFQAEVLVLAGLLLEKTKLGDVHDKPASAFAGRADPSDRKPNSGVGSPLERAGQGGQERSLQLRLLNTKEFDR